ncbi:DUF6689 family protein [Alteromonas hispanica]|uniref:Cohesin domain-containing protein n=1 Tax=Alteromonas hispanica TaxID=315421 RepID=A0A6L9MX00_9ALTE|nr:DUF6689 family protein [Alteromonas hispanica]NDW22794.1 hypothetical protein [Alteromonas hispanica]
MKLTAMIFRLITPAFVGLFLLVTHANAQVFTPASLTIDDNRVQAKLSLSVLMEVDVTLEFENSIGLNADSIEITAELINPTDLNVVNRLPSSLTSAVSGFPVLVSISPKADAGFGFEGPAMVELYTKAIHYDPDVPLRLFTSHDNGKFEDITTLTSSGSFRARGSTGRFSDFIILLDNRTPTGVINEKLADISSTLSNNQLGIDTALFSQLDSTLNSISQTLSVVDYAAAMVVVDHMITLVESADGALLPNVWRSSGDLVNVQGDLLTQLKTLRFSLRVL